MKRALSRHTGDWSSLRTLCASFVVLSVLGTGTGRACVGTDCMQVWSTEEDGGALAVFWDFEGKRVQTFKFFCSPSGLCIYNTIDPGFMTPPDPPPAGHHRLLDGTLVRIEALSLDPVMNVSIEGNKLEEGVSVMLGTAPTLHVHPTWQLRTPESLEDDYVMTFILTTDSPSYTASQEYSLVISNLPPPCPGDSNNDDRVTVDELVATVSAALGATPAEPPFDMNGDGMVSIAEVVAAVQASIDGCPGSPRPTPSESPSPTPTGTPSTMPATFERIQRTIFTPRCSIPTCHDSQFKSGNLVLTAEESYDQLIGVEPAILSARQDGFFRVDPGYPENSFLLVKIEGPPPGQGSRMPLTGAFLTPEQVQLIRDWISQGAQP